MIWTGVKPIPAESGAARTEEIPGTYKHKCEIKETAGKEMPWKGIHNSKVKDTRSLNSQRRRLVHPTKFLFAYQLIVNACRLQCRELRSCS